MYDSQKVIVLYGDNFDRKLEVDLCGEKPWCTLRDFISACEYDGGMQRGRKESKRIGTGGRGEERDEGGEEKRGMRWERSSILFF